MRPKSYRLSVLTFQGSRLRYWRDGLLCFDAEGTLVYVGPYKKGADGLPRPCQDWRGLLAIPGLIDAHCHLSQYPAVACDGLELLPWLQKHIFPLERSFQGPSVRVRAQKFFQDLASHGTTCACVYTTIWKDSTEICFKEAEASGLRVIMGKVMMDRHSYDQGFMAKHPGLKRSQVSLEESTELCRKWHGRGKKIFYAFTPRFALSCSWDLMRKTAQLADRYGAYLQTHLAENRKEIQAVRRAFPGFSSYTEVYAKAGILGPRTVLAHAIWLSEREYKILERFRPAIAHCPTSNAFLASGIMDIGRLRRAQVPMALGSDVAAGPSLCLFSAMRQAVFGQRLAQAHRIFKQVANFGPEQAFYLATLGGAKALGLGDEIGSLEKGKQADFAVLDSSLYDPGFTALDTPSSVLSRMVYRADRCAVRATFVAGRPVWNSTYTPANQ
jgi:guanine deaminase